MDFEKLLAKYIEHVGNEEGVDFIPLDEQTSRDKGLAYMPGPFTDEEIREMNRIINAQSPCL